MSQVGVFAFSELGDQKQTLILLESLFPHLWGQFYLLCPLGGETEDTNQDLKMLF